MYWIRFAYFLLVHLVHLKSEVLRNPDWPQASNPPASISQVLRSQTYPLDTVLSGHFTGILRSKRLCGNQQWFELLTGENSSLSLDRLLRTDTHKWRLLVTSPFGECFFSKMANCVPWVVLGPWLFWVGCINLFLFPIPLVLTLPTRHLVLGKVWWYIPSINSPQEDRSVSPRPVRIYGGPI